MPPRRRRAIDLRPLRECRDYRLLFSGQLISLIGRQITVVALPHQIYQVTGSALAVGLLGAVQVVPLVVFSLVGGAIADAVDRRRLLLATNSGLAVCSGLLALGAALGNPPLAVLYATASGGVIIARFGVATAYLVDVATFAASMTAVALLPRQPPSRTQDEPALRAIATGLRFAATQRAILGGFAIDLNAMIFGLPRALYPVLAATVYHTGPAGLGLLYSAPGAGAVVAALLATGLVGRVERQGLLIIASVTIWGVAILGFGLVTSLAVALALLAVAGAADSVSAVCRSTMMQTLTPDHLLGRTAATYSMVVIGGTYVGDVEAGSVAAATTPRISVISGGGLCLVGVAVVAAAIPALRRYRARPAAAPPRPAAAIEPLAAGADPGG